MLRGVVIDVFSLRTAKAKRECRLGYGVNLNQLTSKSNAGNISLSGKSETETMKRQKGSFLLNTNLVLTLRDHVAWVFIVRRQICL